MPAFLYITSANASADMNKARALRLAAKRYAQCYDDKTENTLTMRQ